MRAIWGFSKVFFWNFWEFFGDCFGDFCSFLFCSVFLTFWEVFIEVSWGFFLRSGLVLLLLLLLLSLFEVVECCILNYYFVALI